MIAKIVWTFILLWPIQFALYWIAMKILRANPLHSLWFATITTFATATAVHEEYFIDQNLDVPFILIPSVISLVGCSSAFVFLLWRREHRPSGHTYALLITPIVMVGHMPSINTFFMLIFDAVGILFWLNTHFKNKSAERERQRIGSPDGAA